MLFKNPTDGFYVETLNERVLNKMLLPNGWDAYYFTEEQLEQQNWEKDDDGYFADVIQVWGKDHRYYFFNEDYLIMKDATEKDIQSWNRFYWTTIVELD